MTDSADPKAFEQSFRNYIEKAVAGNPPLMRLRRLNQAAREELRRRLREKLPVDPFGVVVDENGKIDFVGLDEAAGAEAIMAKLKKIAAAGHISAATLCTLVERVPKPGEQAITFFQMHSEDKDGLAVVVGSPVDDEAPPEGVKGPAVAITAYKKKVSPVIFANSDTV